MIDRILNKLDITRWKYNNIPADDGRFLKDLIIKTDRKNGLEIGSANGYSAIWIGLGMKNTIGHLDTIEIEPYKAKECEFNIKIAGLEKYVNSLEGDAINYLKKTKIKYDFIFFDLGPYDMIPIIKLAKDNIESGTILALHNIGFEYNYLETLSYAKKQNWNIEKIPNIHGNGYGFFLIKLK